MSHLENDYYEPEPMKSDDDESDNNESGRSKEPLNTTESTNASVSEPDDSASDKDSNSTDKQDIDKSPSSTEDIRVEQDDEPDSQEAELDRAFEEVLKEEETESEPIVEEPSSFLEYSDASEIEPEEKFSGDDIEQGFQESELDDILSILDTPEEATPTAETELEESSESMEIDWSELSEKPMEVQETIDEHEEIPEAGKAFTDDAQTGGQEFEEVSSGRGYVVYHPKIDMYSLKGGISQEDALRLINEMEKERGATEATKEPEFSLEELPSAQSTEETTLDKPDTPNDVVQVEDQSAEREADNSIEQTQDVDKIQIEDRPVETLHPAEPPSDISDMPIESSGVSSSDAPSRPIEEIKDLHEAYASGGVFQSGESIQDFDLQEIDESDFIGTPIQDAEGYHEQELGQTCVQASCEGIIHKHHPELQDTISEAQLVQEAIQDGVNDPQEYGTPRDYIKDILDMYDVPAKKWGNANLEDIRSELQKGHDIIVGVDAGVLWDDLSYVNQGHAIRVTGIRKDESDNMSLIYVRDSGNPNIDGMGEIPVDTFLSSWKSMNNFMVSTLFSASQTQAMQGENS